ncbi:Crp/Fnr family transcriptional regulator [Aquisalimonas asiatica]|uniref:cAMP-binding domain of CRP or a regulatory subunit of cAMP-dependent protein kinases n=1 Tax=Aquisalimonas asiatica TaxID=406100 RepID=A0A1H8PUU0_9GAMM|nr:Crp/Fnr family transcriptional regulator [Aquisalimonas asiatica]SEO45705.1 cAMP-binding domain of CRP or a regulatory subunit of cAMP-dependent protein kinases [Aquisalimonas asiatica]
MTDHGIRQALGSTPLFRHLPGEVLDGLAKRVRRVRHDSGDILFHQGDPAHHFFLLEQGLIKLARNSAEGLEKVVHLVRPGETFAEAVMFMDARNYPVTAQILEPAEVLSIPSDDYRTLLRNDSDACMALLADLSMRLHSRLEDIDQLTLQQSRPRVARYLLTQASASLQPGDPVQLPAPKHVIASRLSMSPETLSRILHELNARGVLEVRHREVVVHDPDGLRALS